MRATLAICALAKVFLDNPATPLCGADLIDATNLGPGTVYPGITRLEAHGIIKAVPQNRVGQQSDAYKRFWYRLANRGEAEKLVARRLPLGVRFGIEPAD